MIVNESNEIMEREFRREWEKIPKFLRFTKLKRNIVIVLIPVFLLLWNFVIWNLDIDLGSEKVMIHFPYLSTLPGVEIVYPIVRVGLAIFCLIAALFCFLWLLVGKHEEEKAQKRASEFVEKYMEWEHEKTMKEYHEALKMNEDYFK